MEPVGSAIREDLARDRSHAGAPRASRWSSPSTTCRAPARVPGRAQARRDRRHRDHCGGRRLDGRLGGPGGARRRHGALVSPATRGPAAPVTRAPPSRAARSSSSSSTPTWRWRRTPSVACSPSSSSGRRCRPRLRLTTRAPAPRASSPSTETCCTTSSTSKATRRRRPSGPAAGPSAARSSRRPAASTRVEFGQVVKFIDLGYRVRRAGHRIFLDKDLQGTHLKTWTLRSLIRTDVKLPGHSVVAPHHGA